MPTFSYRDWENHLVRGLSHPGGSLCHYLGQFLSLMQVKPLSRLLMTTEEQDGQALAKNDAIFYVPGVCRYHVLNDSDCPGGSGRWRS